MSLELQLEEMFKTIEQKDKFITKQMMSLEKYKSHDIACCQQFLVYTATVCADGADGRLWCAGGGLQY
ncbi:hypothetical protein PROFUN_00580 [Planoprotostelium fungivorum]|uniref:Uncharacterized protein n=1 Tax=Planoprotostelium fungivorum TaxID=1890364 RepID=A0A2P6N198_9EUKA|nr:hypothetical protein PROFUN_00580 [Planoprotostelium fungivorum]